MGDLISENEVTAKFRSWKQWKHCWV